MRAVQSRKRDFKEETPTLPLLLKTIIYMFKISIRKEKPALPGPCEDA